MSCPTPSSETEGQEEQSLQETEEEIVLRPSAPEGRLMLGSDECSFVNTRRRPSCVSGQNQYPNEAVPLAGRNPSSDESDFEESSESERSEDFDYRPSQSPESGPRCEGSTTDHHLRCEILATQEAMKRNAAHIDFLRNCQAKLETDSSSTNSFAIGSRILVENERLLSETLLVLTAALEDIPDNLRTCDCHSKLVS